MLMMLPSINDIHIELNYAALCSGKVCALRTVRNGLSFIFKTPKQPSEIRISEIPK